LALREVQDENSKVMLGELAKEKMLSSLKARLADLVAAEEATPGLEHLHEELEIKLEILKQKITY